MTRWGGQITTEMN